MPELEELQTELAGKVLVVGVQTFGGIERGQKVLSEAGVTFPVMLDPGLANHFSVTRVPYTVFVKPDGTLAMGVSGAQGKAYFKEQALALSAN